MGSEAACSEKTIQLEQAVKSAAVFLRLRIDEARQAARSFL